MRDVIRLRRGTAAQWNAAATVLDAGEPGYETDTGRQKIGDGSTPWADLPYFLDEPSLATWHAEQPHLLPTAVAGGLVVNVQDPVHGARGDGATDDTAAIQSAIDATAVGGGTCYFPTGTYLVRSTTSAAVLVGRSGVALVGDGAATSVLRVADDSTALRLLDVSRRSDVVVRDLGFEAGESATGAAVWATSPTPQRDLRVTRCRFRGFLAGGTATTYAAIYAWRHDGVLVEDNEVVDCGRAITLDQPDGSARVVGNRVSASDPSLMATGILVRRSSGSSESEVVVSGNTVSGARLDPGGVGAEGHGIAVYRCQDVQVVDNHVLGNGRGVLVSDQSFGAVVRGNTCVDNSDAGIRVEPEIAAKDTTTGQGGRRGVTVIGNVCRDNAAVGAPTGANSGIGIALSYAAGSTVSGNVVRRNTGDGIFCDSDRVTIVGNVVSDNFTGYTADPSTGRRGGIRLIAGSGCTVVGNQCFDDQPTPTQHFGLSITTAGGHVVHGNNFTGNAVGEVHGADKIYDGFFGATPVTRRPDPGVATALNGPAVLNRLVESLRELGLVE